MLVKSEYPAIRYTATQLRFLVISKGSSANSLSSGGLNLARWILFSKSIVSGDNETPENELRICFAPWTMMFKRPQGWCSSG